jgi:hypothetical protein
MAAARCFEEVEQAEERTLACPAGTNDGKYFAPLDGQMVQIEDSAAIIALLNAF